MFAKKMGIQAQNVNKYLHGELDIQNLFIKLHFEGCDLGWLITGDKIDICEECKYKTQYKELSESNKDLAETNSRLDKLLHSDKYLKSNWSEYLHNLLILRSTEIRNRIAILREYYSIDATRIGVLSEIPKSIIIDIENGVYPLTLEYLLALVETGITNSMWLLTGDGNPCQNEAELIRDTYTISELKAELSHSKEVNLKLRGQIEYMEQKIKKFEDIDLENFVKNYFERSSEKLEN